jgi:hypothetical protein
LASPVSLIFSRLSSTSTAFPASSLSTKQPHQENPKHSVSHYLLRLFIRGFLPKHSTSDRMAHPPSSPSPCFSLIFALSVPAGNRCFLTAIMSPNSDYPRQQTITQPVSHPP